MRGVEAQASDAAEEVLARGLSELGLADAVPCHTRTALVTLARRLVEWAARLNLTGHRDVGDVVRELVLDAAALHVALPSVPSIADIGSGAGFPGLPLALLRPGAKVTLIESRERRHHFQRFAIRELELSNVAALRGRAEALPPMPHALALAQAAARPALVLPWLLRWLAPGGLAVIPAGAVPPSVPSHPKIEDAQLLTYTVPITGKSRSLWIGRFAR